jgi:hypothetical protein
MKNDEPIKPIENLQREMNTLREQRRDNAPFYYVETDPPPDMDDWGKAFRYGTNRLVSSVQPGDIFRTRAGRQVVVYYVRRDGTAVIWEDLPSKGGGGGSFGPDARGRFLRDFGQPVAQMRFEGAHKLYRREREKRQDLERRLAELDARPSWWRRMLRRA